jgi:hypothetical protein
MGECDRIKIPRRKPLTAEVGIFGVRGYGDLRHVTILIVGNSLLTGAGFPMCGEFDLKTCLA